MKNYQKPTMKVVELQQRGFLLQATTPPPGPNDAREQRSSWSDED